MHIASIGVDLGKTTFHLVTLGEQGKVVVRKKFLCKQLLAYTANLQSSLIGIEACSGAHFILAALRSQGHDARLIPAQFVKPYVKSNRNDFLDAEAIAEAVARQNMRFVPIKTEDQLDLQALHRVRDRLVHRRTAIINRIRGFLLERGVTDGTLKGEHMSTTANTEPRVIPKGTSTSFLIDNNLGLVPDQEPWKTFFKESGIVPEWSVDLVYIDKQVDNHLPDVAFIPIADFHRVISRGDDYYQALVIGTSKYTGSVNLPSVLVVRKDDTAQSLDDLMGTEFGYINDSCSSSFYAMSVLLEKQGRKLNEFLKPKKVKAWQGQIDAVVAKEVRSTMLPEDVWLAKASNADDTKIIGRYDNAKPAVVVARKDLDKEIRASLINALVTWAPKWNGLYGPFRPYYLAEVFSFYHDLDKLAALVSA